MRVSILGGRRYVYPDIVVTCGQELFEDNIRDTLTNPIVIIEILSESTEAYDRGEKFMYYQTIESLQEYVIVSQKTCCFELFRRRHDGAWLYRAFREGETTVELESIGCRLDAEQVYFKTDFG